jgi:hypothetical protein
VQPLGNRQDLLVLVLLLRLDLQEPLLGHRLDLQGFHNKPQVRVHYWEQIVLWLVRQPQVSLVRLVKGLLNRQRCLDRNLANEEQVNVSLRGLRGALLDKVLVRQPVTLLNNRLHNRHLVNSK